MLFHSHMVHIVKISIFSYRSGYISGAGEMISTCVYMYEHSEKISKVFPGKKQDFSEEHTNENTEVHEP